jgi:hypothetical protein
MDPSETLQRLYAAGFELQTFERFPKAIGVSRGEVMVLLENTPAGLKVIGSPGWRMGDFMGVLTTKDGKQVFQWKEQVVEATEERKAEVERFRRELENLLAGSVI